MGFSLLLPSVNRDLIKRERDTIRRKIQRSPRELDVLWFGGKVPSALLKGNTKKQVVINTQTEMQPPLPVYLQRFTRTVNVRARYQIIKTLYAF